MTEKTVRVKLNVASDRVRKFLAGKRINAKGRTEVDVELTEMEMRSLKRKAPEAFASEPPATEQPKPAPSNPTSAPASAESRYGSKPKA